MLPHSTRFFYILIAPHYFTYSQRCGTCFHCVITLLPSILPTNEHHHPLVLSIKMGNNVKLPMSDE
jgi:hypothetical protein